MSKGRRVTADEARRAARAALGRSTDEDRRADEGQPLQTRPVPEERQEVPQRGESELVLDLPSSLAWLEEAVATGRVASVAIGQWGCRMIPEAEFLRLQLLVPIGTRASLDS